MVSWTEILCGHAIVVRILGKDRTTEATPEVENEQELKPTRVIWTLLVLNPTSRATEVVVHVKKTQYLILTINMSLSILLQSNYSVDRISSFKQDL